MHHKDIKRIIKKRLYPKLSKGIVAAIPGMISV